MKKLLMVALLSLFSYGLTGCEPPQQGDKGKQETNKKEESNRTQKQESQKQSGNEPSKTPAKQEDQRVAHARIKSDGTAMTKVKHHHKKPHRHHHAHSKGGHQQ